MIEIVTILVRGESFSSRFNTQRIPLKAGDTCLVESSIGLQIGKVLTQSSVVKPRFVEGHLPRVIRKTSQEDLDNLDRIIRLEKDAEQVCLEKIRHYRLDMKLVKVFFSFDKAKGLFMFTSDGRVDFRELVRDLAQHFKTRIEMKQIGIRDEARLIGGIGNCGCTLCCQTFLRDFHSVSIKMAKDQGLSLIPNKISGLCGRLMCCLQYEHEHYSMQARRMPKIGKRVITPKGMGKVRQLGILKQVVQVELLNGEFEDFKLEEIEFETKSNKENIQEKDMQQELPEWNGAEDDEIQSFDDSEESSFGDINGADDPNQDIPP